MLSVVVPGILEIWNLEENTKCCNWRFAAAVEQLERFQVPNKKSMRGSTNTRLRGPHWRPHAFFPQRGPAQTPNHEPVCQGTARLS
jgi:hypothetical protein